ncbi:insulinase family protein, partial [bacterium]|nr:insulinase family protein [bacterium]
MFEDKDVNGISRLLSNMLVSGTEFVESWGGTVSSFSGNNSIGIEINLLSGDVKRAVSLLKEMLYYTKFGEKEFEKEKYNMLLEIDKQKEDTFETAYNNLRSFYYGSHPYALNIIGSKESVNNITLKNLKDFYQKIVVPENLVISVFGDVDKNEIRELVDKKFKLFLNKKNFNIPDIPLKEVKSEHNEIAVSMNKNESAVLLGFPGCRVSDTKDRYILELITSVMSDSGGILFDSVRKNNAKAYSVGAFNVMGLYPGMVVMYAFTEKDQIKNIKSLMVDTAQKLKQGNFDNSVLISAKNSLIASYYQKMEKNSDWSFEIALDELYDAGFDNYLNYDKIISSISKEDLVFIANKYFDEG